MTTTLARETEKSEGRAPRKENAALINGESTSSVADEAATLQAELAELPSLDELYERASDIESRLDALKQELDRMAQERMPWEMPSVEVSEVSTRNAHADRMLRVHVNGELAGTVLKDLDGWRVFGDPRTRYASRGDAVGALVAGRRALMELDEGAVT